MKVLVPAMWAVEIALIGLGAADLSQSRHVLGTFLILSGTGLAAILALLNWRFTRASKRRKITGA